MRKQRVLFICTHNSARSIMAEALLRARYGDCYAAYSADTEPRGVHPLTRAVLEEIGIDTTGLDSKSIETYRDTEFDIVITVCDHARETCPFFPNGRVQWHVPFPDPSAVSGDPDTQRDAFRRVRDAIDAWIRETFSNFGWRIANLKGKTVRRSG